MSGRAGRRRGAVRITSSGRQVRDRHLDRDREAVRLPIVIQRAAELADHGVLGERAAKAFLQGRSFDSGPVALLPAQDQMPAFPSDPQHDPAAVSPNERRSHGYATRRDAGGLTFPTFVVAGDGIGCGAMSIRRRGNGAYVVFAAASSTLSASGRPGLPSWSSKFPLTAGESQRGRRDPQVGSRQIQSPSR